MVQKRTTGLVGFPEEVFKSTWMKHLQETTTSYCLSCVTFPKDDVSHVAVGVGRAFLHGTEGALGSDILHLILCQVVAEEARDLTDALAQVLQERKQREAFNVTVKGDFSKRWN